VGRLVEAKGLDVFLRALSGAKGVVGVLVGDGPMRRRLERMARDVGADVRFAGRVAAPAAFYRMANVVVLPSQMEALPMSLIEAAACGAPAIGTRAGGIPEVIEDDESGLLVPPGDPDALRRAIERLRDEPAARRRLGEGARAVWRERFTPERLAAELTRAYDDTLAAKAGERRGAEPGPQS
jgi:glycosyltransferase involved in cell wall biosynthesis